MANRIHDIGIAGQIGTYSDAVETPANARWLVTAGTPGLDACGRVPPDFGAHGFLCVQPVATTPACLFCCPLLNVAHFLLRKVVPIWCEYVLQKVPFRALSRSPRNARNPRFTGVSGGSGAAADVLYKDMGGGA